MHAITTTRRHVLTLHRLMAPSLAICLATTVVTGHAQTVDPTSILTQPAAQQQTSTSADGAFLLVKSLPQHNTRPAPPPNRTSFTKPPPHHA